MRCLRTALLTCLTASSAFSFSLSPSPGANRAGGYASRQRPTATPAVLPLVNTGTWQLRACAGGDGGGVPPPLGRWRGGGGGGGDGDGEAHGGGSTSQLALVSALLLSDDSTPSGSGGNSAVERLRGGYYSPRRRRRRPLNFDASSVTSILLVITAAAFGAQQLWPSLTGAGAKVTGKIMRGQWYRLLTPMLLHANFPHLFMNSMSLYNIGPFVERTLGRQLMLAVYVLSGVGGVVASCVMNPYAPSIGASGAVFGMVGAAGAYLWGNRAELGPSADAGLNSIRTTVLINVFMGMQMRQIDNAGHVGGLAAGFLLTYLFGPHLRWHRNPYTGAYQLADTPRVSVAAMRRDLANFRRTITGRK